MSETHEQSRSLIYLAIILGLIWFTGIEMGLFLSVVITSIFALASYLPQTKALPEKHQIIINDINHMDRSCS